MDSSEIVNTMTEILAIAGRDNTGSCRGMSMVRNRNSKNRQTNSVIRNKHNPLMLSIESPQYIPTIAPL